MIDVLRRLTKKTSCCKIVKYSSLLCSAVFLSPLSHYFDSAGIVTLSKGENRPQRKYESLVEYLDRFRHAGGRLRFAILGCSFAALIFPVADGYCRHTVFFPTASLFPFSM